MNGDGHMDINEFSIACKLITNKLKGIELPKTIPPQMMPAMPGMMPGMAMMQQPGMVRMNAAGKKFAKFPIIHRLQHVFHVQVPRMTYYFEVYSLKFTLKPSHF